MRRWSRIHTFLYRATGGLIGKRLVDNDMLLLTTTGHLSGDDHTVPLLFLPDGDRLVVIASYGGRPNHPTWYENLRSDPEVEVQVRGERTRMKARTAGANERSEWWPKIEDAYYGYSEYQSRTDREIPVVFLEPLE